MRPRLAAVGCTIAGALGILALPSVAANAASTAALPKAALSISTTAASYAYGTKVTFTVTLKDRMTGAKVSVYATPAGSKRTLLSTVTVNSAGQLHPHYKVTRTTTFSAVFAGDAKDAANSATRTVTVPAQVTEAITGYYGTVTVDGTGYRAYHSSGTLTLNTTVAPNKHGECLAPETEQYDSGTGWDADTKYSCDKLDSQSQDSAPFSLAQASGDRYRIRADYVAAGKDTANPSTDGPWLYFQVVK